MKAVLRIKNIGGLLDEHEYSFESDKINVIASSNSGGKTSIVRALTSVLSIPSNGEFDRYLLNEAFRLGIKTDPRNPREGFVNIYAETASVELELADTTERYEITKQGKYISLPSFSDQRFLLTGILSNESRIIRQLNGLEDYEPDDFRWAVTLLSNAKGYDQINEIFTNYIEDIDDFKLKVNESIMTLSGLIKDKIILEKKNKLFTEELSKLLPRFSSSKPLLEDRERISNEIIDLNVRKGDKKGEMERIKREELEIPLKRINAVKFRRDEIVKELNKIKIEELEKKQKIEEPELEKKINLVRNRRSEIDALLNLFITAKDSIKKEKSKDNILCPLCLNGEFTTKYISNKISEYRVKKDSLNKNILKMTNTKFNIEQTILKQKNIHKILRQDLLDIKSDIRNYEEHMRIPQRAIVSLESTIEGYDKSLNDKLKRLEEINKLISKSDDEVNDEYTKKENDRTLVSQQLGIVLQQIGQHSSVEVFGNSYKIEAAIIHLENILNKLKLIKKYTGKKAEQERQEAAKSFNDNIEILINNLQFTNFRNVKLNTEYRLYIERLNPDTNEYVMQQPKTLSTSEKLAISLVLQLALKETYLPNIPFFIIDDIMEDFDEDRLEQVYAYLLDKSKQENLIIIITKLIEEKGEPKINYLVPST